MSPNETPQGPQDPNTSHGLGNYGYAQNPQEMPNPQAAYNQQYGSAPAPGAQPKKKKGGCFKWGAIVGGVLLVVAVLTNLNGGTDSTSEQSTSSATETSISTDADAPNKDTNAPNKDKETASESAAEEPQSEQVPTEYKNALRKAKTYSDTMHMSKAGIYDQLTSEYGEKFTAEEAQYAVDNL